MSRPISTRRARLVRDGVVSAVIDWQTGLRSTLHPSHPTVVIAYARTMARLRRDQLIYAASAAEEEAKRAALVAFVRRLQNHAAEWGAPDNSEFARIMKENGFQ